MQNEEKYNLDEREFHIRCKSCLNDECSNERLSCLSCKHSQKCPQEYRLDYCIPTCSRISNVVTATVTVMLPTCYNMVDEMLECDCESECCKARRTMVKEFLALKDVDKTAFCQTEESSGALF